MKSVRFAVFGHPVSHSLSPRIHQAFAQQFGIPVDFSAIDAAPAEFAAAVAQFMCAGGRGANVTLPHKAAALILADLASNVARRVGAANVLTRRNDGRLAAHNTDGAGMLRDMQQRHGLELAGRRVLLLGAGGAARAAAFALLDARVGALLISNRTPERAHALAAALGDPARVHVVPWSQLAQQTHPALLVNATSAGVLGAGLELAPALVGADTACYDLSYGAAAAAFVHWGVACGARHAVDGLGMLVETAADAFELWHERRPATGPVYAWLRSASTC